MQTDSSSALQQLLLSRLRLRHLALLSLVATHRRISRVADVMRLGQPAITKALKDVEDIFGTPLFERAPGGLQATEAGEVVLHYAQGALADLAITSQKLAAIAAGLHGRIRLGVIPHGPDALLAAAMNHVLGEHPKLSIVIREMITADLVQAMQSHELDCAIGRAIPAGAGGELVQELIFEQTPAVLVSRAAFDRIAKRPLDWQMLSDLEWILQPPNTPMRQTVDGIFIREGVPPPIPVVETSSLRAIETALRMLQSGVTILARDLGERLTASDACRVLPYELGWKLPPICLLLPAGPAAQPGTVALAGAIRAAAKELSLSHRLRGVANF